jgi:hypothetical protein
MYIGLAEMAEVLELLYWGLLEVEKLQTLSRISN